MVAIVCVFYYVVIELAMVEAVYPISESTKSLNNLLTRFDQCGRKNARTESTVNKYTYTTRNLINVQRVISVLIYPVKPSSG